MTWGRRLDQAALDEILKRGHVRLVHRETPADKRPGRKAAAPKPRPAPAPRWNDTYAGQLANAVRKAGLPQARREYLFCPGRKFRADLAWPERSLLVEVKGSVHRLRDKFARDIKREQIIFKLGFRLLQVTPLQVRNGEAIELVRYALTEGT